MQLKFFKAAAEDCGFMVGEPTTQGGDTTIDLYQKTPEGKEWWEQITFTDPKEIGDIILERIDTFDLDDAESWYNEETGEVETFDSLVDDELWKYEKLNDLYNRIIE